MPSDVFIGPVVQVFVKEPARGGMLQNVYLKQLAGRDFLVGSLAPYNESDQRAGNETWGALDHVQMMIHFPDVAAARSYYTEAMKERQPKQVTKKTVLVARIIRPRARSQR